ncbi:hypothetical protein C8R47DRAFT_1129416 [Mycena vitilis]|nr:hypothetical protein C8R47DRAFT_1129416 [Mycena vitilis]
MSLAKRRFFAIFIGSPTLLYPLLPSPFSLSPFGVFCFYGLVAWRAALLVVTGLWSRDIALTNLFASNVILGDCFVPIHVSTLTSLTGLLAAGLSVFHPATATIASDDTAFFRVANSTVSFVFAAGLSFLGFIVTVSVHTTEDELWAWGQKVRPHSVICACVPVWLSCSQLPSLICQSQSFLNTSLCSALIAVWTPLLTRVPCWRTPLPTATTLPPTLLTPRRTTVQTWVERGQKDRLPLIAPVRLLAHAMPYCLTCILSRLDSFERFEPFEHVNGCGPHKFYR